MLRSRRTDRLALPTDAIVHQGLIVISEERLLDWLHTLPAVELRSVCDDNPYHLARDLIAEKHQMLRTRGCGSPTRLPR